MKKITTSVAALFASVAIAFGLATPANATTVYITNSGTNDYTNRSAWYSVGSGTRYLKYYWVCDYGYSATMFMYVEENTSDPSASVIKVTLHKTAVNASGRIAFTAKSGHKYRFAGTGYNSVYFFTGQFPGVCTFAMELES